MNRNTPEQFKKAKAGCVKSRNEIIESNIGLINKVASKYTGRGLELDDLFQEGVFGIIDAIKKYDLDKGFAFTTFATHDLKNRISRAAKNYGRTVRVPVHIYRDHANFCKEQEDGLTYEEIAKKYNKSIDHVKRCLTALSPLPDTDETDALEDLGIQIDSELLSAQIRRNLLTQLKRRESFVIACMYGLNGDHPKTLDQVAEAIDISRERVRQIKNAALIKLRFMI